MGKGCDAIKKELAKQVRKKAKKKGQKGQDEVMVSTEKIAGVLNDKAGLTCFHSDNVSLLSDSNFETCKYDVTCR
jgi:hypothetical protein